MEGGRQGGVCKADFTYLLTSNLSSLPLIPPPALPSPRCYGGLFIGLNAAEVLGDYGCGPNHTLPTGGTGRYTGGLSVFSFLGIRTWIMMGKEKTKENRQMVEDTVIMARCEGLEGHARAAEKRL